MLIDEKVQCLVYFVIVIIFLPPKEPLILYINLHFLNILFIQFTFTPQILKGSGMRFGGVGLVFIQLLAQYIWINFFKPILCDGSGGYISPK